MYSDEELIYARIGAYARGRIAAFKEVRDACDQLAIALQNSVESEKISHRAQTLRIRAWCDQKIKTNE